jgi:hypothetical protein
MITNHLKTGAEPNSRNVVYINRIDSLPHVMDYVRHNIDTMDQPFKNI